MRMLALLHTESFAGHRTQRVEVLRSKERKTLVITADGVPVRLPGRYRMLLPGEQAWVPTHSLSGILPG